MATREPVPRRPSGRSRTTVIDRGARRPFMRGIMVHSLMARGIPFDDAFEIANRVRDHLGGRAEVSREELAELVARVGGERLRHAERPDSLVPESIEVTGSSDGEPLPFSKGQLAQSLLAAALDPHDAHDVAREVEAQIRRRGVRTVDRATLRKLVYEALRERHGTGAAERYLVWRRFQEPERPVILLFGGAPGVGKTSLALEVAHRLGIRRVLSADSIRQIMRITLSRELVPAVHASSYEAYRVLRSPGLHEDPVIEGYRAQAEVVSVGVRAMMDRAIAENTSLILDGVSILPGLIDPEPYRELAHVVFLVVATLDVRAYRARFQRREKSQRLRRAHRYLENLDAILKIQDHFLEMADQYDVPIITNDVFDQTVLQVVRHVSEALRKSEPAHAAEAL